jgi:hypothetical protein
MRNEKNTHPRDYRKIFSDLGTLHELKGTSGLKGILNLYILFMKALATSPLNTLKLTQKALFFIKYIRRVILADY